MENIEQEETEFIVKDFDESIDMILSSDELEIDGILVTEAEKDIIRDGASEVIQIIRELRA
jgi:leucyl aminopeptidase (aminopeptidase T)